MTDKNDKATIDRVRAAFDDEVAGLDAATRSRLTQARYRALAQLDKPRLFSQSWLPQSAAAAVAVAAVLAIFIFRSNVGQMPLPETIAEASDIEILLGEEEIEFLQELEFYAWLETQPGFDGLDDTVDGAG